MADKNKSKIIKIRELAEKLGLKPVGDGEREISAVVSPEAASGRGDVLCAIWDEKALLNLDENIAVIAPERLLADNNRDGLICEKPRDIMPELLKIFAALNDNNAEKLTGIHAAACVSPEAVIDKTAFVGAFAVVEAGAVIKAGAEILAGAYVGVNCEVGENSIIEPRAVLLKKVKIGKNCLLHSGCVLGCDGFGFVPSPEGPVKIPQNGGIVVGDNVEIGACTTIDCGTLDDTVIGSNTKIDNHVQIGHNVKIGRGCIICSMSGIAGSSVLEDGVILSVQAGVTDHVKIGAGAVLAARSGVTHDVPAGAVMSGFPLQPHKDAKRSMALFTRLPDLLKRIKDIEHKLNNLDKNKTGSEN